MIFDMKDEALKLGKKGFKILPCNGKVPCLPKWNKCASNKEDYIINTFKTSNNIAILTGDTGCNLIVIDCDVKNKTNGIQNFHKFINEKGIILPDTLTATSGGGGKHFYFRCKSSIKSSVSKYIDGVDIRANGGCIIAPPSVHPNGNRYTWDNNNEIVDLPIELELLFTDSYNNQKKEKNKITTNDSKYDKINMIKNGERNNILFRLSSKLMETGLSIESILEALKIENKLKCETPLKDEELDRIVSSSSRYKKEEKTESSIDRIFSMKYQSTVIACYWLIWYKSLYLNKDTIYISQKEICDILGFKSTKTIHNNMEKLREDGFIEIKRVKNNKGIGTYGVNSYKLI